MRDIAKLSAEIHTRIAEELDSLVNERSTARAILLSRSAELAKLRDAEVKRIEQWAEQQKIMIKDVFGAIISENQADIARCDMAISRLDSELKPASFNRPPLRTVGKAAAAFAKAAK